MKECKYCRTMYADNLLVCPNCGGNKIVTAEERAEEIALKQKEKENRENAMAEPLKMRKNILIGVGTVVGLLLLIIVITSINANKPYSDGTTKDQAAELLDTGKEYFDKGEYEAAIECFAQLPTDSKEYEEAQTLIEKSAESYRKNIISKVDTYVQNGEWEIALELIKNAQKVLVNDEKLQSTYNKTYDSYVSVICNNAKDEAKAFVEAKDFLSAMKTLENALTKITSEAELSALYTQYSAQYEAYVIQESDNALKTQGYQTAISIAQEGLNNLPNSSAIANAISNYETYAPVYLIEDIDYLYKSSSIEYEMEAITDNRNVEYSGHYNFHGEATNYEPYMEFQIDKKYKEFHGTAILIYAKRGHGGASYIRIYGDDKLLYQSDEIMKGFETDAFTIDVSNVNVLKIEFDNYGSMHGDLYPYLTNAYFIK